MKWRIQLFFWMKKHRKHGRFVLDKSSLPWHLCCMGCNENFEV